MVTIKDVARRANVSFTTVSHVINQTRPVSPGTADAVRAAIVDLGYLPSGVARALQSQRTRTIGMVVTTTTNPFFGEVIRGVERRSFERGYTLMLCNTDDVTTNLVAYTQTLLTRRVDAIVVMTSNASPDFFHRLAEIKRIPMVGIDAPPGALSSVFSDDSFAGGRVVADCFLDRGFTRIACVTGPLQHPRMADRITGFTTALAARGLVPTAIIETGLDANGGWDAARRMLESGPPPQAVFALSDTLAIGLLHGIFEHGYTVPRDISVVGYDDIDFAAHTFPPLTTMSQPAMQIGAAAADALIDHLETGAPLPILTMLQPTLIERASVGHPA